MQVAHVGAEIALQPPERGDHSRRHAIFLLGARERSGVGLDPLLALLHAIGRGHASGKLREDLAEHALATVAVDDALVVDQIGRGGSQRALRHALGYSALLEVGEKLVERRAAMARSRARRGGGRRRPRRRQARCSRRGRRGSRRCRPRRLWLLKQLRGSGAGKQQRGRRDGCGAGGRQQALHRCPHHSIFLPRRRDERLTRAAACREQ